MEKDNEREVMNKNENTLRKIIDQVEKRDSSFVVDRANSRSIGVIAFKRDEEAKSRECFLIVATYGGQTVNLIYDEDGDFLSSRGENGERVFKNASGIDLNLGILDRAIEASGERERIKQEDPSSNGTAKAGDGRSLGNGEHETNQKKVLEEKQKNVNGPKTPENEIRNLNDDINLDGRPLIRLDQIINGYPLWELLGIEEKIKDRLPSGVNPKAFRTGFLSFVDSKELEAKDGKKRVNPETFVITSFDKSITIELDEQILQPVPMERTMELQKIEQTVIRKEDGEETEKAKSNTEVTRTSLYEIPNVKERFSSDEGYRLSVDKDRDKMLKNERQAGGHDKEVTFIQYSLDSSYTERQRGEGAVEYRLKSIDEPRPNDRDQDELAKDGNDEGEAIKMEHINELVDEIVNECFEKVEDIGNIYNREKVKNMIKKDVIDLHREGKSDEEIKKEMTGQIEDKVDGEIEKEEDSRGPRRNNGY